MFNSDILKKGIRLVVLSLLLAVCTQAVGSHSTLSYAQKTAGADSAGGSSSSSSSSSSASSEEDPCKPPKGKAYEALLKAVMAARANQVAGFTEGHDAATKAARENMGLVGSIFGDPWSRLCLEMFTQFTNLVEMLLGIAGTILAMLIGFINQLLSLACQYVVAAITNLLTQICIPLPDLPSMPGFGGPDRKSCNGLSMADMLSISTHPIQVPYYSRRQLDETLAGYAESMRTMLSRSSSESGTQQ